MYQIIALELAGRPNARRWVVASGFSDARGATDTLKTWIGRHFPQALHHEESAIWLVEERGEPQACYFIEMEAAAELEAA